MTLNTPSFFAGIGTVLALLLVGFGGGVMMSGVVSDKAPREPNKIEKRAAETAKPPVLETKPAAAVAAPAPPSPQATEPAPAPVQQVQTQRAPMPVQQVQSQPASEPVQPPPAPPVRRVDLPPPPAAQPQPPAANLPPEPQPTAPSRMTIRQVPLGPEHPVALTSPAHDPAAAAKREARRKAQEARKLEQKRKREERKLAEQRRQQSIKEARELKAATERSRPQEVDDNDDDRDQRPSFFAREPDRPFERPFFRLFGGGND